MKNCKVAYLQVSPVYVIFDENGKCIEDGIGPTVKIYPGMPISIELMIKDVERAFSCTKPTKPGK